MSSALKQTAVGLIIADADPEPVALGPVALGTISSGKDDPMIS